MYVDSTSVCKSLSKVSMAIYSGPLIIAVNYDMHCVQTTIKSRCNCLLIMTTGLYLCIQTTNSISVCLVS